MVFLVYNYNAGGAFDLELVIVQLILLRASPFNESGYKPDSTLFTIIMWNNA